MQRLARREALDRANLLAGGAAHRDTARSRGVSLDQDRASTALALAAAVFRAGQMEIIPQNAEQIALIIGVERPASAVDQKFFDVGHSASSGTVMRPQWPPQCN